MTHILIYQDYVHNNGALYKALAAVYGVENIRFADAEDITGGILDRNVSALVMPGGASRYVSAKLDGAGNAAIRAYVAGGGAYIGICAGAYYACRRIEWTPGFDQRFMVDGELGFFPGTAKGPVPQFVAADNPQHMAQIVPLQTENGEHFNSFYWAGPVFDSVETDTYTVKARYASLPGQPPAVVTGDFGKGRYLLCGPHPEIDSDQLALMRFEVVDNRFADIAVMPDIQGVDHRFFHSLLSSFIG